MIKVTVGISDHNYPKATDFYVNADGVLYVSTGTTTLAVFAYTQWSHVERVGESTFDLEPRAVNYLKPQHTCTCGACDPQVAVRALHRED